MDVQTYFFRRSNINALGQPRSWTDHLLWHHAAHTVDLFRYQARSGAILTLSLSFNNNGPLGSFFRYIGDSGTYIARYDDLFDGYDKPIDVSKVDVSMNGIELQDREFFAAIKAGREPNSSVAQAFTAMQTLDRLEQELKRGD
jgi:2-hydroxy-4-carboxymuconate semialdehyde hemiacetal dehydrogenase